ncbi:MULTISPECIES: (2S)-3-sulfopropanediol dehydratase [unclassified Brenneria]|uniref:(2S)-3-sulfopropanediol dehydratase n=1 Tax=unclassified Brenneria TaxID=2634434 RepID=UPI0018F0FB1E|nr:pyruvate formate lyase family protein [Brenneria sp. L3-3C-1]MBJ7221512.1 glycyl radical protein [Brenneria sp. L3-3C-1]MEE3642754.1 pyruvate formate lyase family protein [Brenneria sp. L3_3C_1]
MSQEAPVLSPQESRLLQSSAAPQARQQRRTDKILTEIQRGKPGIDVERARYFTASMRATEGQLLILRWAKAMYHIAQNITVYIDDEQLIVGRAGKPGRYGILYPELDGDFLDAAISQLPSRMASPFTIDEQDSAVIREEISPYWQGKTYHESLSQALPEETLRLTYDPKDQQTSRFIVNETSSFRSSIQWVHDYEKVLQRGFKGIRQDAEQRLAQLDPFNPLDSVEKAPFLQAIIIAADAIVLWAKRHARLAGELAQKENNLRRRQELLEIAERCERVPEHPARDFRDALQAQWFTQLFSRLEQKTGTIISNGRMDQYLFPYYQRDIEQGVLNDEQALEWLSCVWVSMAQFVDLYISPTGGAFNEGYAHWEAVTIGGQTPDGMDATNALSHLFLRSKREFPLHYPDLAARIHNRTPARFLHDIAETIKEGTGFPKLINDEEVVPLLLSKGAEFSQAYDYAVSGCAECRMPNRDTYTSPCAYINFPAALEMTLYNGRMKRYGSERLGLETGDPLNFATWEDFWQAYIRQHINFLRHAFIQQKIIIDLRAKHFAWPLGSALHDLAMAACKDIHQPTIDGGIDLGYFEFMGYGTVIDSLAAIKKLVYEERRVSMSQLLAALENDFEHHQVLRALLMNAPKYGNNDPYADDIGKALDKVCLEFTRKYSRTLGVHLDLRLVPFTSHVPFGKVVHATPNGRKAWMPLSDGSSASQGCDSKGPTAVLLSNYQTKNYQFRERAARLLNIKFTPSIVAGETGTRKLCDLIRAWCDLKLWHVQFNVINRETLLAAKADPERYRGLIVRIAGYSAYFTDLSPDLQDDLIARTGHEMF